MRHPRRDGLIGVAAMLSLLFWCGLPLAASAAILDELPGRWAPQPNAPLAMDWAAAEDGFTVSWTPPGAQATTVHFTPTGRPGVYGGASKAGRSMMDSMFGDDGPVNPLEKGALYWARAADDAVFLYRLVIGDQGELEIDRYACRPDGGALAVSLQRRTSEGMDEPIEQRLVRAAK